MKRILGIINCFFEVFEKIITFIILGIIILVGVFSAYSIWDDGLMYRESNKVRREILQYKPEEANDEETDEGENDFQGLSRLKEINNDVKAWITVLDTKIDYPVLQTNSNFTYLNKNVFGEYALAGSIFMDCRNSDDFEDPFTLIYGHYMNGDEMFGSLSKFKEESFFNEHRRVKVMTEETVREYRVIAVMVTSSSDENVFKPENVNKDKLEALVKELENKALFFDSDYMKSFDKNKQKMIALSTCSYEYSGARTVVFCIEKEGQD